MIMVSTSIDEIQALNDASTNSYAAANPVAGARPDETSKQAEQ
jgi:hypothetical protein